MISKSVGSPMSIRSSMIMSNVQWHRYSSTVTVDRSRTTVYTNSDHPEISLSHFQKLNLENYKWIHFEGRCAEQALMMMHIREWNKGRTKEDRISISLEVEQPTGEYEITAQLADYVFVSKTMAQKLGLKSKQEAVKSGSLTGIDGENVIVLCGSDGAFSRISGYIYGYDAHPPPNGVVDRIGAGECFIANTIYALSRGNPIREAIPFGCRVAGYKVGVLGLKGLKTVQQVMYNRCFNKPL